VAALTGTANRLDQDAAQAAWASDFYFDSKPPVALIPYAWLTPPFRARADQPVSVAQVTRTNAGTLTATSTATVAQYGYSYLQTNLDTVADVDVDNLAGYQLAYYTTFRMRCPSLTVNLLDPARTTADLWLVLGVAIGTRLSIPDAPATWPAGANSLIVEGINHQISQNVRTVTWNTSPIIGTTAGVPGPWFRMGSSSWSSPTDLLPY